MSSLRVRFTVRRMMVAVALAGVLLGLFAYARELRRRSDRYEFLAFDHLMRTYDYGHTLSSSKQDLLFYLGPHKDDHEQLMIKYQRAARYPWLPVEPDPPPPVMKHWATSDEEGRSSATPGIRQVGVEAGGKRGAP